MMLSLLATSSVSFLAFVFLIWVGWVVGQRPATTPEARLAGDAFAVWWYALAASSGASGLTELLAATVNPPVSLVVGLQFLNVAAICMGLAGLLYYLVYLYSGWTGLFWPLTVGYALFAGVLMRAMAAWGPTALVTTPMQATLSYAQPASEASILMLLFVLIGPQLLASFALFVLATRLPQSASRVRLLVVAAAIFMWFGSAFVGMALGVTSSTGWDVVQMFIPVLVGLSVFLIHRPPPWLEKRMPPELPTDPGHFRNKRENLNGAR